MAREPFSAPFLIINTMCRIKFSVLHCGSTLMSPSMPYGRGDYLFSCGFAVPERSKVWLPASAYLIEHPKGNILIDTGWGRQTSPTGNGMVRRGVNRVLPINSLMSYEGKVESHKAVSEQLERQDITPRQLDYVILTHMGPDRVSGLESVADARHILVSDIEYKTANSAYSRFLHYQPKLWNKTPLTTFSFEETGLGPVGKSYDLFGDGSVELVHLPGFTRGMTAVVVRNEGKFVLIYSDAGFGKQSWRKMLLPGLCADRKLAYRSLMWVRQMSLSPDCVASFANHDPEVVPQTMVI